MSDYDPVWSPYDEELFDGLPGELMESANVDGANIVQTYFKIYLPLAKPAVINLVVLQLMWSFQDFYSR